MKLDKSTIKRIFAQVDNDLVAFSKVIKNSAIEECAKRCESFGKMLENDIGDCFAEELRAMKEKP